MHCSSKCKEADQIGVVSKKKGIKYPHLRRARVGKCLTCGETYRAVNDFGTRVQRYCSHGCYLKNRRVSHFEIAVGEYIEALGIGIERQVKLGKWNFDIWIKGTNILVEADGHYWHSLPEAIARDKRKDLWCSNNDYVLVRIKEMDFRESKNKALLHFVQRYKTWCEENGREAKIKLNGEEYYGK